MEVHLAELNELELKSFLEISKEDYAVTMSENQGLDINTAREKAERLTCEFILSGINKDRNFLLGIVDQTSDIIVGGMMYQLNENNKAFLLEILIFEKFRRKGYAMSAFKKLETRLRLQGVTRLEFNVFESNKGAYSLYKKLGYQVTNFYMAKNL